MATTPIILTKKATTSLENKIIIEIHSNHINNNNNNKHDHHISTVVANIKVTSKHHKKLNHSYGIKRIENDINSEFGELLNFIC